MVLFKSELSGFPFVLEPKFHVVVCSVIPEPILANPPETVAVLPYPVVFPYTTATVHALPFGVTLVTRDWLDDVLYTLALHSCDVFSASEVNESPDGVTAVPLIL
jgi:hypothetical protein